MGIYDNWTYTDLHQLNLDWVLKEVKAVKDQLADIPTDVTIEPLKVFITPEMYGAVGDGITDDTVAIQKAIDTAVLNKYKLIFGCRKEYAVSRTLFINGGGIDIDFQESTIKPLASGYYSNNFVMALNSEDCQTWLNAYPFFTTYIRNLRTINSNQITDLSFMFVAGPLKAENVLTRLYYGSFIYPNLYIDYAEYNHIHIMDNMGSKYAIEKRGQGDAIVFNDVELIAYTGTYNSNINGISLGATRGCVINSMINGNIKCYNSAHVSVNNSHFEKYEHSLTASEVEFNNCYFWRHDKADIAVLDTSYTPKVITFNNCRFVNRYDTYSYNTDFADIDASQYYGTLLLNNTFRLGGINASPVGYTPMTSIMINTINGIVQTDSRCNQIVNGIMNKTDKQFLSGYAPSSYVASLGTYTNDTGFTKPNGTYHYRILPVLSKDRILANGYYTTDKSVAVTDHEHQVVRIRLSQNADYSLRIYRGTDGTNWPEYVDIDYVEGLSLIDVGDNINGFAWISNASGTLRPTSRTYLSIRYTGDNNVMVIGNNTPSYGDWKAGDIILSSAPTSTTRGWVCTADGTPGTWAAF